MNEPATFLNGAIGGCRNDLLNMPPYVPRKSDYSLKVSGHYAYYVISDMVYMA